jgi:predicted alpha/beta superfamily hydrolase
MNATKRTYYILSLLFLVNVLNGQEKQKTDFGRIDHIENFPSKYVDARNIDIWLPESYDGQKKFAVLYMHDGQMLFDATATWNKQSWDADHVASQLMKANKVKDFIIVGIWNSGPNRHVDYFPEKPFESLSLSEKDTVSHQLKNRTNSSENFKPNSDNYLKFLVTEIKPMIDKRYSVYKDKKNTFVAGSSMGGLISMYAMCEYPEIFGGAACISTHWIGSFVEKNNPIPNAFIQYLEKNLHKIKKNKIYFDTGDQGLDASYLSTQEKIDDIMKRIGFTKRNWKTMYFEGKDHTEKSWNERFDIPVLFLLGRNI